MSKASLLLFSMISPFSFSVFLGVEIFEQARDAGSCVHGKFSGAVICDVFGQALQGVCVCE